MMGPPGYAHMSSMSSPGPTMTGNSFGNLQCIYVECFNGHHTALILNFQISLFDRTPCTDEPAAHDT